MLQTRAALLQRSLDDTLFWRPDEAVSVITGSVFLRAAARVASALPEAEFYLNLCRTPCGAAIAVAAAMLRGRPCILVTDHSEASIAALLQRFPGAHPIMESADERCTPLCRTGPWQILPRPMPAAPRPTTRSCHSIRWPSSA